jgi:hypothetical protein
MAQCEHEFLLNEITKEVKCVQCGVLDDEMQLSNPALEIKELEDDFYKTQINFE